MAAYKTPDFNERATAARTAKEKALEQLRAKPAPDPALAAERQAARAAREARAAEARAAKQAAIEEAKIAKAAAAAAAEAEAAEAAAAAALSAKPEGRSGKKSATVELTDAEKKAARDARYAARRARKR